MLGSAARHWFSVLLFSSNSSPVSKTFQHWHLLNGTSHLFPWQLPNISPFAHYSGVPRPSRWENAIWECQQLWNVWHILWVCRKIGYGQEVLLARTGLRDTEWTLDKRFILSRKRCRFWIAEGLQEGLSKMLCSKLGFLLIRLHSSHWLQIPFLPSYVHISIICEGVGDFIPSVNPNRSSIHL